MEVTGQKSSKENDVKLCSFCEDYDITTYADGFCVECEVFICHKCFVKHKVRKNNRDHSLVKVGESHSAKTTVDDTFEACQHHTGKLVELYCQRHDQVCCGVCIVLNHNGCKLELVQNKAAAFKNSSDFNSITQEIRKYDQQAQECATLIKINKQQLPGLYEQFVYDVKAFADEVIERVNTMKKILVDQANDVMLKEDGKMNEIQRETEQLIADLSHQKELLVSKIDQPNKLFAASVLVKPELKKIKQQLEIIQKKNIITRYSFKRNEILESALKEMKEIGQLHEHRENETSNADKINNVLGPEMKPLGSDKKQLRQDKKQLESDKKQLVESYKKQLESDKKQLESDKKQLESDKKQRLLERKLRCRNIQVDGDVLSYAANSHNEVGLYVDNKSVNVGDFFEIKILSLGRCGSIALGLVPMDYPGNLLPGEGQGSKGYHSDGKVYKWGKDQSIKGQTCKEGDHIRCTITTWYAVFIHNGKEICSMWAPGDRFAVGMMSEGDKVKVIV